MEDGVGVVALEDLKFFNFDGAALLEPAHADEREHVVWYRRIDDSQRGASRRFRLGLGGRHRIPPDNWPKQVK
jgi:hypothetical protein